MDGRQKNFKDLMLIYSVSKYNIRTFLLKPIVQYRQKGPCFMDHSQNSHSPLEVIHHCNGENSTNTHMRKIQHQSNKKTVHRTIPDMGKK
jgi:hypothetical protein